MKQALPMLAALLAALLAACGQQDSPAPPAPVETAAATPVAPAAPAPSGATVADAATGESVYRKTCALCHATAAAGAPMPGDNAEWPTRIGQGMETLYKHSIEGYTGAKGVMPPKGANLSLSDQEVMAAVDYMVAKSQPD